LRQYIDDALVTVPCVIFSRIRRVTDPRVFVAEALALYLSFLAAAWKLGGMPFLRQQWSSLRLAIPTVLALGALMLGDAYVSTGERSPVKAILEAGLGVGFAFLLELVLSAANGESILPRWIMVSGCIMGIPLVAASRMIFPPDVNRPRGAT
jgi:hypothetical protein